MTTPRFPDDPVPDDTRPLSGVLAGRYEITGRIGEGGMAVVYRARDLTRDVDVAIKTPKAELVAQLGPQRFAREIQISTQLQHPHIVPVLDSGVHDGIPFYVMPFIDGESLSERLQRSGPLAIHEAVALISEVLDGLAFAHARGFVHRDVKPANVMLSRGHAQIADFGIARAVEHSDNKRLTESGFALGTAEYMSPEQATGEKNLDGRSDIYSVGCVLYEMLVGSPPFTGSTSRAIMARHFVDPVPAIRTVRDTVPEPLESIVFTAMAKTPADRYQSAESFLEALRDPAVRATLVNPSQHTSQARVGTLAPRAQPRTRTRGVLIGAAIAVGVAGAAITAYRTQAPTATTLDPNRVMVFPFEQSTDLSARESLGEDVATIIGNALDAAEPLRWVDGWASLDSSAQASARRNIPDETARRLAQKKRCAYVMRGRLTKVSDAVEVALTLYDVSGDSIVARGVARGTVDDPWKQGLAAVNKVLPRLIASGDRNLLKDWENRPPAAVANFLLAEGKFRRLQIKPALQAYRNALDLDSTFAIAALRGAQAASWAHDGSLRADMLRLALAQPLPERSRYFALGLQAYLVGAADSAIALLTHATQVDPENFAAWAQLGETYVHLLPGATSRSPDALADAAFSRARALDSTAASVLFHPLQIRIRRGERVTGTPMFARFLAAGPNDAARNEVEMLDHCVQSRANPDTLRAMHQRDPLSFLSAGQVLGASGANLQCTRAIYELIQRIDTAATDSADGRRYVALTGLVTLAINRGDSARAHQDVKAFEDRWPPVPGMLLTAGSWSPMFTARARAVARVDSAAYGSALTNAPQSKVIYRTALFELATGGVARAAQLEATLRTRATMRDSLYLAWYADAIRAQLLVARGDSSAAEVLLRQLLARPASMEELQWDLTDAGGLQRLTLARLLLARGRAQEAWNVANVFDSSVPMPYLVHLPASLEIRATAAKQLGAVAAEREYRARLAALTRAQ